jgi:lycopene beta-cyclase
VLTIGARAGLVKASTGYAYQRDSVAIAESLARHGHPFDRPPASRRHRLLNAALLDVLNRDPGQLGRVFARLFTTNPAERVLRFLDENSTVSDELHIIAFCHRYPYLRAVARSLRYRR